MLGNTELKERRASKGDREIKQMNDAPGSDERKGVLC